MVAFQCDNCLFYLLKQRYPIQDSLNDKLQLICIRRANLDAMWARETSTVENNRRQVKKQIELWNRLGVRPTYPQQGPFPYQDIQGVAVAVAMLLKSLDPGRYAVYTQYETIRKFRSAFSNVYMASVTACLNSSTFGRSTVKSFLTHCPTQSIWFERFATGCLKRMGQIIKRDLAISIEVLHHLLKQMKSDVKSSTGYEKHMLILAGAFSAICFCRSFRGHEVFLTDLKGLIDTNSKPLKSGPTDYVIIPLLGRFKGETGERYQLTPLAALTASGIELGFWVKLLIAMNKRLGLYHGPVFCLRNGDPVSSKHLQPIILSELEKVQANFTGIIPESVDVQEDYGISRSFRRGAATHATNMKVSQSDIDAANRWRNAENAQGRKINQPMRDHYAEVSQMVPTLLRFSAAL